MVRCAMHSVCMCWCDCELMFMWVRQTVNRGYTTVVPDASARFCREKKEKNDCGSASGSHEGESTGCLYFRKSLS